MEQKKNQTRSKIYGIIDESGFTNYVLSENAKDAFWEYLEHLGNFETVLHKADSVLLIKDLIYLFNEYNHQGYKITGIFSVKQKVFGEVYLINGKQEEGEKDGENP